LRAHDAVRRAGVGEALEEEAVGAMRSLDRDAEPVPQFGGAARVIDMAVGEQDLLHCHARLGDRVGDAIEVAARIDDGGPLRRLAPQEGAVLLERRDRDDDGAQVVHGRAASSDGGESRIWRAARRDASARAGEEPRQVKS
jgi:hypothetical protein